MSFAEGIKKPIDQEDQWALKMVWINYLVSLTSVRTAFLSLQQDFPSFLSEDAVPEAAHAFPSVPLSLQQDFVSFVAFLSLSPGVVADTLATNPVNANIKNNFFMVWRFLNVFNTYKSTIKNLQNPALSFR